MDDRLTRALKVVAIVMAVAFVGWAVYDKFFVNVAPGDMAYHDANKLFEDGYYERAAARYRSALEEAPGHIHALRGLAQSLHKMGAHDEALLIYDEAIAHAPEFGPTYANRGILRDTMGRHEEALADYMRALELAPELADGPHWLTRFLRNQPEAPPTIADRAAYLRAELAKPEAERVLRIPEIDAQQRPYQQ
ncbi:MAG TPA: tetratricopeptide repeat protein [Geminicoccaceae bacterium]|nr:tetratricopeptide repeat protein [Geminicoccaceae bacterium]